MPEVSTSQWQEQIKLIRYLHCFNWVKKIKEKVNTMDTVIRTLGSHDRINDPHFESILISRDQLFDKYLQDYGRKCAWQLKEFEAPNSVERIKVQKVIKDIQNHLNELSAQLRGLDDRLTARSPLNNDNSPYL